MTIYAMIAVVVCMNAIISPRGEGVPYLDLENANIKREPHCKPVEGPYENQTGLEEWRNLNCNNETPYCPSSHCDCSC